MRGVIAKRIRREIYDGGHHPGPVQYQRVKGTIEALGLRRVYQKVKELYNADRRQG